MKLIVSDFDGTYYTDDLNILKNNMKIKEFRKDNNLFMLSSGRSFNSLKKMTEKYNIEYDYLSCCDGSILYDKFDNIIIKYDLNNTILKEFLKLKDLVKIERIQYSYPDDYYPNYNEETLIGCNIVIENEEIKEEFINSYNNLKEKYKNYDFLCYKHDDVTYFCLKNKGINKSITVKYLKDLYNLDFNDIYTFGDNENDYPMLSNFNSYYIGNPDTKIKNVCIKGLNQVHEFFEN